MSTFIWHNSLQTHIGAAPVLATMAETQRGTVYDMREIKHSVRSMELKLQKMCVMMEACDLAAGSKREES